MSIRWWAYQKWTPPFTGSKEEELSNFITHNWVQVVVESPVNPNVKASYTSCSKCHATTHDDAQKYKCGEVPEKVAYEQYKSLMVRLGRGAELPIV